MGGQWQRRVSVRHKLVSLPGAAAGRGGMGLGARVGKSQTELVSFRFCPGRGGWGWAQGWAKAETK